MSVQTGTIETKIPSRLDRLPWSRFHWLIIGGLGTAWILDGLEVTMVGSLGARLTSHGSGIAFTVADVGVAAAIYVIGACVGALFFGQLCDRFGRKKLFMITLGLYIASTVLTAFSFAPWFFFLARFLTGTGIGGEYAAINSAIDELIPARLRGRVDLVINGSYWLGSIAGSGAALFFLSGLFPTDLGWRFGFGVGAVIGLAVLVVRRSVPESPRWLFIHGREDEAEAIVREIEEGIEQETGRSLSEPDKSITVRQRSSISFREIARVAFKVYPGRSFLCLALFVGQAFLYNGITFNLGTLMTTFFKVSSGTVPIFLIVYAAGNFAGPLLLGRLFDTIGRKPMIAATYIGSALISVVLAGLFVQGQLDDITFIIIVVGVFFLASAGASAAYLTASEIFPMETRALAIAFFYAIGTGLGGIIGPLLFGNLIATAHKAPVALAFLIGAAVMALGGVVELFFGVKAEGAQLEDIAKPITAADADYGTGSSGDAQAPALTAAQKAAQSRALAYRARADEERAAAAEHRAVAHEHMAEVAGGNEDAAEQAEIERLLAEMSDVMARAYDERATASDALAEAIDPKDPHTVAAARERAAAAEARADAREQEAEALLAVAEGGDARTHEVKAKAAMERARSREQRALAEQFRADDDERRAEAHDLWAEMHLQLALAQDARSADDHEAADEAARTAEMLTERARAAEERVEAAEHLAEAEAERRQESGAAEMARRQSELAERQEAEARARQRIEQRLSENRSGMRRYRPGPGRFSSSPGWAVTSPLPPQSLENEIASIRNALDEHGATERDELSRMVGARYWGPGVFREALRQAVAEGGVRRLSRSLYALPEEKTPSSKTA